VRRFVTAADPDAVLTARKEGGDDAVATLIREAVAPLTGNSDLRARILEIRREKDILFDEVNGDELAVLQVLHSSGSGRPTYTQLHELAERVSRVPTIGSGETRCGGPMPRSTRSPTAAIGPA
jgi:type I restriction enzyme R subunit